MSDAIIPLWRALLGIAIVGSIGSSIYLLLVLVAALRFRRISRTARHHMAPKASLPFVSLMKPVHGMEPCLQQNLESFFQQDYPHYQIVFGARSPENSAVTVVEELRK